MYPHGKADMFIRYPAIVSSDRGLAARGCFDDIRERLAAPEDFARGVLKTLGGVPWLMRRQATTSETTHGEDANAVVSVNR